MERSRAHSGLRIFSAAALVGLSALGCAAFAGAPAARAASEPRAAHASTATAEREPPAVQIDDVWIPQPPPGTTVAAAYFTISNMGHVDAVLTGVSCPLAAHATLHRTMQMNGVSMMRAVPRLEIAPSHVATLRPDGLHVMLEGVRRRFVVGERVPLVLHFKGGVDVRVSATVRPLGSD